MSGLFLKRLTAPAVGRDQIQPIPWKAGQAPKLISHDFAPDAALPDADILHWVYTTAETEALADVFTPGVHHTEWASYAKNWGSFEGQLTSRSPAREEKCIANYALVQVGDKRVIVLKNNLHLATDSVSLPLRQAWVQMIQDAHPSLVIDSGTAGGVGADVQVGDAVVANALRFDCTKAFADQPFAHEQFACTASPPASFAEAQRLMAANAHLVAAQTTRPLKVWTGTVLSTDFFAMDTSNDHYGLRAYDPAARAVEMDASVLGLVAQDLGVDMPQYVSVRSASDPQMVGSSLRAEEREAEAIYVDFGYGAQVAAECVSWQLMVG